MKKPRQFTSAQEYTKIIFLSALLLLLTLASYGQKKTTSLSEAKSYIGATTLGTKAYFAGGGNCDTSLSKVEIYDVITEQWDNSHDLSVARVVPTSVACDGKVFFAGGYDFGSQQFYSEVDIFDTQTMEWDTVIHLSVARVTSAVCKDSIVIFAGGPIDTSFATTNIVDIYNTRTEQWDTATLSVARDARTVVVVGDLAMFAGGHTGGPPGQKVSDRVDIYDFTTKKWTIDSLSVARDRITATVVGNKALFAGGMTNNNKRSDVVDIYNATTRKWETAQHLSYPRAFSNNLCAATVCGKAVFAGGGNLDINTIHWTNNYDNIDIYDPNTNTWSVDNLPFKRIEHAVVAVGDQLLVAGGLYNRCQSNVEIDSCPVGVIPPHNTVSEYTIYPNPAKDELIVNASFKNKTSSTLVLFDIIGRTIYQYKFSENMLDHQIDLSSFSPGTYLLEIKTSSERFIEKVMILE